MASFNDTPLVSAVNGGDTIHITDTGGNHRRVTVDRLIELAKAQTLSAAQAAMLDKLTSGCFIAYNRQIEATDGALVACRASQWSAKQNQNNGNGEVATGVLVVQGGHSLLVAPTQSAAMAFGSGNVSIAENTDALRAISDMGECFKDFNGRARTDKALSTPPYSTDGATYAVGFCNAYSAGVNINGRGKGAGSWWLPSIGELMMMKMNMAKIDLCLSLINGANTFVYTAYWSSTQHYLSDRMWRISLGPVGANMVGAVKSSLCVVRPVTSY